MNSPLENRKVRLRGLGGQAARGVPCASASAPRGLPNQIRNGHKAARLKAEILAIGGIEDHVHVLLKLPATVAIATLVKQLKGSSSHLANHEVLPRGLKWQGGYSASSVSRRALHIVRDYVQRQEEHHRDGTIFSGCGALTGSRENADPHRSPGSGRAGSEDAACSRAAESAKADFANFQRRIHSLRVDAATGSRMIPR